MGLKFGVTKLLCICIGLTKFEKNPQGSSIFRVDLTWNDPNASQRGGEFGRPVKSKVFVALQAGMFDCSCLIQVR